MGRKIPIFYSALLLTLVNLILRFAGTAFQVFLSARIGAEGIGLLQLVLSVGSLALVAGMAGIRTGTMYLTATELGQNRAENIRWVLSGCIRYSLLFSTAVAAAAYFLAQPIASGWIGYSDTRDAVRLIAVFLPVNCLCGVMVGYFTAAQRIGTLAAVEVAEQLAAMACTYLLLTIWAGSDRIRCCLAVILGSCAGAVLTLVTLLILRLRERPAIGKRIPIARRLADTALPLAAADDLKAGISTLENLLVPKRLALYGGVSSPLASFGVISGMVFPVLMFPAALLYGLAELLIPEIARCAAAKNYDRVRYLTRKALKTAAVFGVLICGVMHLWADALCNRLYANTQAAAELGRYALLIPMLYCDVITDAVTKGLGQQKLCVRNNICTSALDVALLYILLPQYGLNGYFVSFLVTHLLNFLLSLHLLSKHSGVKLSLTGILSVISSGAFSIAVCTFLPRAAFPAILLAVLCFTGTIGNADLLWLKRLLKIQKPDRTGCAVR